MLNKIHHAYLFNWFIIETSKLEVIQLGVGYPRISSSFCVMTGAIIRACS